MTIEAGRAFGNERGTLRPLANGCAKCQVSGSEPSPPSTVHRPLRSGDYASSLDLLDKNVGRGALATRQQQAAQIGARVQGVGGGTLQQEVLTSLLEYQFAGFFLIVPLIRAAILSTQDWTTRSFVTGEAD